jgi:hypothetical protein
MQFFAAQIGVVHPDPTFLVLVVRNWLKMGRVDALAVRTARAA